MKPMHAAKKTPESVSFDDVAALTDGDMRAVDKLISASLASDVVLVS